MPDVAYYGLGMFYPVDEPTAPDIQVLAKDPTQVTISRRKTDRSLKVYIEIPLSTTITLNGEVK